MRKPLKLICILLTLLLTLSFAACKDEVEPEIPSSEPVSSEAEAEPEPVKLNVNPLTGLETLTDDEVGMKPLAIAINNVKVAQSVQAGVENADVVYETVTEAGITRLLAIIKAPRADMGRIGTVRSARAVFAELAASMDAVYVHHGMDELYCRPRVNALKLKRIEINSSTNGERISNGKASEHTLYTSGEKLRNEVIAKGYDKGNESEPWLNFVTERDAAENTAMTVEIKFSGASKTSFEYDPAAGTYIRSSNGSLMKNYFTDATASFTNVFVLFTNTSAYDDNYHTKVDLKSGKGYYVTGGGYEEITWSKSGNTTPIKFKNAEGATLSVAAGKSYICIVDKGINNSFTVR